MEKYFDMRKNKLFETRLEQNQEHMENSFEFWINYCSYRDCDILIFNEKENVRVKWTV
jgi:hypothetical protein